MHTMAKKKKAPKRRSVTPPLANPKHVLPRVEKIHKEPHKLFQIAHTIWKASQHQDSIIQDYRRKEAIGWALAAARQEAEQTATNGGSLADCLRGAIKELEAQLHFLGKGDGT